MDINRFGSNSPGKITPISGGLHAFMPFPLPPAWKFPDGLWPLLAEAKQQLGLLEGIGRSLPNPGILLRPLEDREAIKSSRLEGTYVTQTELLLFEMQPKESQSEEDPANSQREVLNYRRALHQAGNSDLPVSLRFIRDLHHTLLTGVRGRDRSPGEFRKNQVAIGSDYRFVPPPPDAIMDCLDPLEKYFHAETADFDPLVNCFLIHYQFETIHPFNDGNGRVGRLLLAFMLKKYCGLSKPWLYLSDFFEKNREEYIKRLFDISVSADWGGWIEFCLRGSVSQTKDTIQRCGKLLNIRDNFMQRLTAAGGSVRLNKIVESIFYSPFIRIADLPEILDVTYPTAKADVDRLVEIGILSELENVAAKNLLCA